MKKSLVAVLGLSSVCAANASTDITGTISSISGYMDAAIVVGIAVLLFTLGRRIVRKLV